MRKRGLVWGIAGVFVVALCVVGFAATNEVVLYPAGDVTVGLMTNTSGQAVTGLHIEFDQAVTIVNKVEVGGALPFTGETTGTSFDLAGGNLVASGTVELDWKPAAAKPVLVQWLSGTTPVGQPYFTTIQALGQLLAKGIVAARQAEPQKLQAAFEQFFKDNAEYFAQVSQSLGTPLKDSLMPIIMSAPAEGIENFFNTLVGLLGATSLNDVMNGDVNFTALFTLFGL
jgi:hypothetical protein